MKPTQEALQVLCPEVEPELIQEHLTRLNDRYFQLFSEVEISAHLRGLSRLSQEHSVELLIQHSGANLVDCTVLGFDYPGIFSLFTGILAGMGFVIHFGEVFTYARSLSSPPRQTVRNRLAPRLQPQKKSELKRRRIVDRFSGMVKTGPPMDVWCEELERNFRQVTGLMESGQADGIMEAKRRVNEMVVARLSSQDEDEPPVLYPVEIKVDNSAENFTRLRIVSEDTPAFLYSLTHAFTLHGIYIEHVRIRTSDGHIEDQIDVLDSHQRKIQDPDLLNKIKLSVLLTKQFTYFLGRAPDPYAALERFKQIVEDIVGLPNREAWLKLLANPHALKDLARVLGASDYLWADFIRVQVESLMPILDPMVEGRRFSQPIDTIPLRLRETVAEGATFEEKRSRLNAFKDREIYLIDLDDILSPDRDFGALARRLTALAEAIVNMSVELAYEHLVSRYGKPRSAAGLEATYAVLGLGKLGGVALGYASDIEFLLVYSDNGETSGAEQSTSNAEFFNRLVQTASLCIEAKREGIFHVDLRLRPYGDAGPLASSLESFCSYYGMGGPSHSFERLSLVRMRAIGGDKTLGARVERIRDELIYASKNIDLQELRALRGKQFREKTEGATPNAKFSPGGLVDLEYNVQILQVRYGDEVPRLRTPKMHEALAGLADAGVLTPEETSQLIAAYDFFRPLINAMRLLRGSAKDLFFPPSDSVEFAHLARRMGYRGEGPLSPARQLLLDYETHSAAVRAFAERHFGRSSLPGPAAGTVADLVLSDHVPRELYEKILTAAGFRDPRRAYTNLKALAGEGTRRHNFAKLALLAFDILSQTPDPDMALNNWERFLRALPSADFHFHLLIGQPMRLEILLNIFSGSQFLSDTLIRYPGFLDWIIIPENLKQMRPPEDIEQELTETSQRCGTHGLWLNQLRRLRRRAMLRIGTRDMYLNVPTQDVTLELSILAERIIQAALDRVLDTLVAEDPALGESGQLADRFCILAMGKLGGQELNYSSDVDLLGIFSARGAEGPLPETETSLLKQTYSKILEHLSQDLSRHTEQGYAYRVDLRLRPYGSSGELVSTVAGLLEYYEQSASLWEIQAALKMRPIAGNLRLGRDFLQQIRPVLLKRRDPAEIVRTIEQMRRAAMKKPLPISVPVIDVKNGVGGIRDVEFLAQGLQLIHGPDCPSLLHANTLAALTALRREGFLPEEAADQLKQDYVYLRRVEHYLQILEDRQIHSLPRRATELDALAKRISGIHTKTAQFLEDLQSCFDRNRQAYRTYLLQEGGV